MKKLIAIPAIALLAACANPDAGNDAEMVATDDASEEVMALTETTWTFTYDDAAITESIDTEGNYIANAGEDHYDHGTYEIVDGKHCFTSAMNDDGQICWTAFSTVEVGETVETTSDDGETLAITRVEYQPLTM